MNKITLPIQTLITSIALLLTTPSVIFAQNDKLNFDAGDSGGSGLTPIQNYAVSENLTDYAGARSGATFTFFLIFIWRALIFVAGFAVLIALVTGAIEWINAGGDKGKIEKAREKMTQAVVGFVVLIGLLAIAQFLQTIFGVNILSPTLPTVADPIFN